MDRMDRRDFIKILPLSVCPLSILLLADCGEKYSGEPGGESQTPATTTDGVTLISAEKQSDHRWKYVIGLDSKLIKGLKTYPFVSGEHTGWKAEPIVDTNGDGIYEVTITVFNREVALVFGGDNSAQAQSKWSWADITEIPFYSATDDAIVIGLCDGQLYKKGQAPFVKPPGDVGDNHLRFVKQGNKLTIYMNNNRVNGSVAKPFIMGSWDNWQVKDQIITDSSGWGIIAIDIVVPVTLEFIYGGYYDPSVSKSKWTWPTDGSSYFSAVLNKFVVCISENGPINISSTSVATAGITTGACTVAEPVKLISSQKLADHRWQYKIGLRSDFITGSKARPFIMGEHTNWGAIAIADADSDGWYEATFEVFEREVRFMYGGDNTGPQSQWTWANGEGKYFSIADNAFVIGFKDGAIYEKGEASFSQPPGETGDSYARFTLVDNMLTIYFNNNKVSGSVAEPGYKGEWTSWLGQSQEITDSSGWGKITVNNIIKPATLKFVYYGDTTNSSINLSDSTYYNILSHDLEICVQ